MQKLNDKTSIFSSISQSNIFLPKTLLLTLNKPLFRMNLSSNHNEINLDKISLCL